MFHIKCCTVVWVRHVRSGVPSTDTLPEVSISPSTTKVKKATSLRKKANTHFYFSPYSLAYIFPSFISTQLIPLSISLSLSLTHSQAVSDKSLTTILYKTSPQLCSLTVRESWVLAIKV